MSLLGTYNEAVREEKDVQFPHNTNKNLHSITGQAKVAFYSKALKLYN